MKLKPICFATLSGIFVIGLFLGAPQSAQSQAKTKQPSTEVALSAAEKEVMDEVNGLRAHPDVYASYLAGLKPFFKDKQYRPTGQPALITEEGWSAVEDAIAFLRAAKPSAPLTLSRGLCLAAAAHMKDQSATGATGHQGSDSGLIENRVKPFGVWDGAIGENLSYGSQSARERILTWLIDDGVASRGHRKRLLSPDYKVAGLSCGPHAEFGTMCALTLAGGFSDVHPAKHPTTTKPKRTNHKRN